MTTWAEINNQILRDKQEQLLKELIAKSKEIYERKFAELESKSE